MLPLRRFVCHVHVNQLKFFFSRKKTKTKKKQKLDDVVAGPICITARFYIILPLILLVLPSAYTFAIITASNCVQCRLPVTLVLFGLIFDFIRLGIGGGIFFVFSHVPNGMANKIPLVKKKGTGCDI